jgi:hypothetical protein
MQQLRVVADNRLCDVFVCCFVDSIEVFMSTGPIQRQGVLPQQVQNQTEQSSTPSSTTSAEGGTAADLGGPITLNDLQAQNLRTGAGTLPSLLPVTDTFSTKPEAPAAAQDPVQKAQTAAVEKFQDRLLNIFGAAGLVPSAE